MLPFVAGATQQFHALPACVEDQNIEIGLELANDGFQVDNLGDIGQQQDLQELFLAPELQELFSKISDSEIHFCVDPELVLENAKMPSSCQAQRNNISPAIPLSVQQAQMDNIDQQTISQPDWIQDAVQFSQQQQQQQLPGSDDDAPTSHPQLSVDRLAMQACRETTDQTVPFRRHDSLCSVLSSYSDIKRERCSISEAESTTPSSPFLPTTVSQTSDHHGGRRGRPCVDDCDDDAAVTDKKQRRRAQNRRAATKCRLKRRAENDQLRKDYEKVTQENAQLKAQLIQFVTHYERLQNEFCRHQQQCGLTLPPNAL